MKWIESQEEKERPADSRRELLKMAKQDAAKAQRTKNQDEKEALLRDSESRRNEANNL